MTLGKCRNGHERTPENARPNGKGGWRCLACKRAKNQRYKAHKGFQCNCCKAPRAEGEGKVCTHCRMECSAGIHRKGVAS